MKKVYYCTDIILDISNEDNDYEGIVDAEELGSINPEQYHWKENYFIIVNEEVFAEYGEEDIDVYLGDEISSITGFCVQTFTFEESDKEESERVLAIVRKEEGGEK